MKNKCNKIELKERYQIIKNVFDTLKTQMKINCRDYLLEEEIDDLAKEFGVKL